MPTKETEAMVGWIQAARGPRVRISVRLEAETALLLGAAALEAGLTRHALATRILEEWVNQWNKEAKDG